MSQHPPRILHGKRDREGGRAAPTNLEAMAAACRRKGELAGRPGSTMDSGGLGGSSRCW